MIGDISLRADADKKPVFGLIRTAIEFQDKKWQLSNGFCFLYSTTETKGSRQKKSGLFTVRLTVRVYPPLTVRVS